MIFLTPDSMGAKSSFFRLSRSLNTEWLKKKTSPDVLLPYSHLVSDDPVPHVENLYSFKGVQAFEKDLDLLLKHFRPLDLMDVLAIHRKEKRNDPPGFLLTFDDGLRQIHEVVAPILKRKGVNAVFFINSGFVGNKQLFHRFKTSLIIGELKKGVGEGVLKECAVLLDSPSVSLESLISNFKEQSHRKPELNDAIGALLELDFEAYLRKEQPFMSEEELVSLKRDGFQFGSHSVDHPMMHHLPEDEQLRQVRESTEYIVKLLDLEYSCFSFPHLDSFLTKGFFERLEKESVSVDLFFGTQNMKPDSRASILHRFNIERPETSVADLLNGVLLFHAWSKFRYRA